MMSAGGFRMPLNEPLSHQAVKALSHGCGRDAHRLGQLADRQRIELSKIETVEQLSRSRPVERWNVVVSPVSIEPPDPVLTQASPSTSLEAVIAGS